jgi:hypothetical protein
MALWTESSAYYINLSWDNNLDLSGLKTSWDISLAFVMIAVLTISLRTFEMAAATTTLVTLFRHCGNFVLF